ncbi:hypothetical protein ACT2CC_00105 [Candidatus Vidania fulgoroideorum]
MKYINVSKKNILLLNKLIGKNILFIYVSGNGCMGIKYNFCKKKKSSGICLYKNIYTDLFSFIYIVNSKLYICKRDFSYVFKIKNNIIKKKCSCGISFKI